MNKNDLLYGRAGDETLQPEVESVVESIFDEACWRAGESFDTIADRVEWPLRIMEFRRMDVSSYARTIADKALKKAIQILEEENGDPYADEDPEPSEAMKEAAAAFAVVVVAEYVPWACEPTGREVVVSRNEAKEMVAFEEKAARGGTEVERMKPRRASLKGTCRNLEGYVLAEFETMAGERRLVFELCAAQPRLYVVEPGDVGWGGEPPQQEEKR